MYTIEAAYIFSIILLVIGSLVTSAIKLQSKINGFTRSATETAVNSHLPDGAKDFQPEAFIRMVTHVEPDIDPAEGEQQHYTEYNADNLPT